MPVHLYGHPFDLDPHPGHLRRSTTCRWSKTPRRRTARNTKAKPSARSAQISCFSFYPGKNLGAAGEGGALVTNNAAFAKRARSLREHGSTVRYYHDEVGFNYRMEGIQGAVLGVKLQAS